MSSTWPELLHIDASSWRAAEAAPRGRVPYSVPRGPAVRRGRRTNGPIARGASVRT